MLETTVRRTVHAVLLPLLLLAAGGGAAQDPHGHETEDASVSEDAAQAAVEKAADGNGCISCHSSAPGELSRAVIEWKRSVHAENSVTCDSCHGGDPSVQGSPEDRSSVDAAHFSTQGFVRRPKPARKVSYFCGRCHAAINQKHLGSPHGENVHPTCTYCHGHHEVRSPETKIIDPSRCTVCHDFRNALQIRGILEETEKTIAALDEHKRWLEEHDYHSLRINEMQAHSRSSVTQLRIAFHSFNLGEVMNFSSQLKAALQQTEYTVDIVRQKEEAKSRQIFIGLGIAALLIVFAIGLMQYKRFFLSGE